MWKDRILATLLAVTITAAATAAVVRFTPKKPAFTPAQLEQGVTFDAAGVAAGETVASVDGNDATAELYVFWLGSECANLANYGVDVAASWDTEIESGKSLRDFVQEDTLMAIKQQLVLENLCTRYGVTLSDEDEAEIAAQRAEYIELYGGEEAYLAELYRLGIGEEGFLRLSRTDYLYKELYNAYQTPGSAIYASDDVLHAYAAGLGYITVDQILISTADPVTKEPLDEAKCAEKRALAEELLWRLRDSADPLGLFDELADQYSEDPGRVTNPHGYTFTEGRMVSEFETAARALGENEYSDLVQTQYGYHIILRRPLDVSAAANAVREQYFSALFLGEIERAELQTTPALEKLDPETVYTALQNAQNRTENAD